VQVLEDREAQQAAEPVAYLDIGNGGYVDLGSDLSIEHLSKLPWGRHMLGTVETYGADGYKASEPDDQPRGDAVFKDIASKSPNEFQPKPD